MIVPGLSVSEINLDHAYASLGQPQSHQASAAEVAVPVACAGRLALLGQIENVRHHRLHLIRHLVVLDGRLNGVVTPDARTSIEDLLRLDPKDSRARYFAGLASEQEGDKAAALAAWTGLLNDTGANGQMDGSLALDLKSRIADLKREMGIDDGASLSASS